MSAHEYMTYLGFGSMNAGVMILMESMMYRLAFAFIALVYCAFATKTLHEDKENHNNE